MRVTACAALIMLGIWVPSAHPLLESLGSGYVLGSVAMLAIAARARRAVAVSRRVRWLQRPASRWLALLVAGAGLGLMAWVASRLLPAIFIGPPDPTRGDMLVIIDHAITAFLAGGNPYGIHKVPWDAPLSYGPVLWLPFVVPHALRVDLRVLTLAAQLVGAGVPPAAFGNPEFAGPMAAGDCVPDARRRARHQPRGASDST